MVMSDAFYARQAYQHQKQLDTESERESWIEERTQQLQEPGEWADPFDPDNFGEAMSEAFAGMSDEDLKSLSTQARANNSEAFTAAMKKIAIDYWASMAASKAVNEADKKKEECFDV